MLEYAPAEPPRVLSEVVELALDEAQVLFVAGRLVEVDEAVPMAMALIMKGGSPRSRYSSTQAASLSM
jgi:hypothetical protein